jgi:EAL domain-containing protein (putative c-di-GMP-specific phosphodiesterase class I)
LRAGFCDVPVAVNISYREYSQPGFVATLSDCLARYHLAPQPASSTCASTAWCAIPALGRELAERLRQLGV